MIRALVALSLLALLALLVGCGGGGSEVTTARSARTAAAAPPSGTRASRAAARPALPRGWHRVINRKGGFSIGRPPGWRARTAAGATRLRSADRGLALSVTADHGGGVADDPRAYVGATLHALEGYANLRTRRSQGLIDAPYPAATASARGRLGSTGVEQRIVAIALRPRGLGVTYSLLAFSAASRPASRYTPAIEGLVATFRAE